MSLRTPTGETRQPRRLCPPDDERHRDQAESSAAEPRRAARTTADPDGGCPGVCDRVVTGRDPSPSDQSCSGTSLAASSPSAIVLVWLQAGAVLGDERERVDRHEGVGEPGGQSAPAPSARAPRVLRFVSELSPVGSILEMCVCRHPRGRSQSRDRLRSSGSPAAAGARRTRWLRRVPAAPTQPARLIGRSRRRRRCCTGPLITGRLRRPVLGPLTCGGGDRSGRRSSPGRS